LRELFEKFGKIKDVSIKNGYAFIDFLDGEQADKVLYR
jgi:RNA recognition motif-containing protein